MVNNHLLTGMILQVYDFGRFWPGKCSVGTLARLYSFRDSDCVGDFGDENQNHVDFLTMLFVFNHENRIMHDFKVISDIYLISLLIT